MTFFPKSRKKLPPFCRPTTHCFVENGRCSFIYRLSRILQFARYFRVSNEASCAPDSAIVWAGSRSKVRVPTEKRYAPLAAIIFPPPSRKPRHSCLHVFCSCLKSFFLIAISSCPGSLPFTKSAKSAQT